MTEEQLQNMFILLHKPIAWDPIPWWIKLNKDQVTKFNEVQGGSPAWNVAKKLPAKPRAPAPETKKKTVKPRPTRKPAP